MPKNTPPIRSYDLVIEWRSATKWKFLPQSDLSWTTFCVLLGDPRKKKQPLGAGHNIVNACNRYFPEGKQLLEFRIRP